MNYTFRLLLLSGLSCFFVITSVAQRNVSGLRLKKSSKGFYLDHKVTSKQSLFAVGRLYNVHPRHLAEYNSIDYNNGIQVDQVLRIPLTDTNFNRRLGQGVPITLLASTDDLLSDIAMFVGVSLSDVQCWNNYSGAEVKRGSVWIVGFLNTSELAGQVVNFSCPTTVQTNQVTSASTTQANVSAITSTSEKTPIESSASFFETAFQEQIKNTPVSQQLNLISAVFKTQSGWKDGKFYLLIENLVPGTIVRLMNPSNNKVVFAKVLGEMAPIKQNEGLDMRISDAAASLLEVPVNGKFPLMIFY